MPAPPSSAFVSADQIVCSWLLNRSKSIHSYYKAIKLCADGVQELALDTLPMVKHTILTKPDDQTWFDLPRDFVAYCSVGIRQGEYWRPVGVDNQLMPMPRYDNDGQFNSEYSGQFNRNGNWTNWVNPTLAAGSDDFSGDDFNGNDFSEGGSSSGGSYGCPDWSVPYGTNGNGIIPFFWSEHFDVYGESTGRYFGLGDGYRPDVVCINVEKGIIMVPTCFPCNHLYLVYLSYGKVDTMTYIDVRAKAAIDAYITWKYFANKRNMRTETLDAKAQFDFEHRKLRARLNDLSVTDVRRIIMKYYGQTQRIS